MEYTIFKSKVEQLIEERKEFHPNDDFRIYKYWDAFSDFMATDEANTIKFFDKCDEETAGWMSEVFEDLSERIKSEDLIIAFEKLDQKFPHLNLTSFVEGARSFL